MATKNLKQAVTLKAKPSEVYDMLMDSRKHAKFTGSKAKVSKKVGGKVSCYNNSIQAMNVDLVKNKRIVQAWRGSNWPKGHYSIVTFVLTKAKNGTKITLTHDGIPASDYKDIKDGWKTYYWDKMKAMLK